MNPTDLLPPELLEEDPLLDSTAQLEETARALDLEECITHRLKHPDREIAVSLPLLRDDSEAFICAGFRVQHSRARPCLGPVLFAPDIQIAELRALALHRTLQHALLDLPLGGSAGAIVCDPSQLSERELRHLIASYVLALSDVSGPHSDIFAPADFAAAWAQRLTEPASLVGKPAPLGGLPDPPAAVAAGWLTLISENLRAQKSTDHPTGRTEIHQPPRIALQGFGPAAAALARRLREEDALLIAVADKSGGLLAERGLDLSAVDAHVEAHGMLYGFPGAEPVRNSEVLEASCDVLIAAAAERQINAQNAPRIHASIVLEGVCNAITPAASATLVSRGIRVIPALLGTAPQTLAWFAEWQNGLRYCTPEQSPTEFMICHQLAAAFHRAQLSAVENKISLPDACRNLAVEKLARVLRLIG